METVNTVTDVIYLVAQSPWALIAMSALLVIDGFFPVVPGEISVVTLATLGAAGHGPSPLAVLLIAACATIVGDGIAFLIGRSIGVDRWAWQRRPKTAATFTWASERIRRNPALILIAAKFVPFARVAVTMTAGASGLPTRRFLLYSFLAAALYTIYHVAVATTVGALFSSRPLFGLAASIGFGLASGALIAGVQRVVVRRRVA